MTYNELQKEYEGYTFISGTDDWDEVESSNGECSVDLSHVDEYDETVFFDVLNENDCK